MPAVFGAWLSKLGKGQRVALAVFLASALVGGFVAFFAFSPAKPPPHGPTASQRVVVAPQAGGRGVLETIVRDGEAHPIQGAEVLVRAEGGTVVGLARSDASGRARIPGLLDATFSVLVSRSGFARTAVWATVAQRRGEVAVSLAPGTALRGSVVDDEGHAVAGATVVVRPENDDSAELGRRPPRTTVRSRSTRCARACSVWPCRRLASRRRRDAPCRPQELRRCASTCFAPA
ncbi:MAG: carboxypeptidase regulatory-like domain-containing protein [Sandaracinaceae bacterium]|nr:carboxypeptidase regulatory-like domain-containing protein [Sandaracinaceae bacterium]